MEDKQKIKLTEFYKKNLRYYSNVGIIYKRITKEAIPISLEDLKQKIETNDPKAYEKYVIINQIKQALDKIYSDNSFKTQKLINKLNELKRREEFKTGKLTISNAYKDENKMKDKYSKLEDIVNYSVKKSDEELSKMTLAHKEKYLEKFEKKNKEVNENLKNLFYLHVLDELFMN